MGRKRLYHTEEEKADARRRNRMNWYDRNRKGILKAYKLRKEEQNTSTRAHTVKPAKASVAPPPKKVTPVATTSKNHPLDEHPSNKDVVAPQIILGRVHKQHTMLRQFMESDAEVFCARVASEVLLAPKDDRLVIIKSYMERVETFIDGARPNTMALWNKHGMISEWREAKAVQNNMLEVIQYLDEIHHRCESGDLEDALALKLLSFQ